MIAMQNHREAKDSSRITQIPVQKLVIPKAGNSQAVLPFKAVGSGRASIFKLK